MRSSRLHLIVLGIALGLAALAPAGALASGPSAGDQQYVDPLGGSTGSNSSGSHSSHSSGSPSAPSSPSASSGSTGTIASGPTAATTASTTTATTTPTATTTSATTTSSRTLPFTGFNAWAGALIGVALVGGGAILRRRVASRTPGR